MDRMLLATAAAFAVGAWAAAGPRAAAAQDFARMDAAAIQARIVGNTLTGPGRRGDCTFFDHIAMDGAATARCGSYDDAGRWRLVNDELCVKWAKRPTETCLRFFSDGTAFRVVNPDRGPQPFGFRILQGKVSG
jgi:hypothetical protein